MQVLFRRISLNALEFSNQRLADFRRVPLSARYPAYIRSIDAETVGDSAIKTTKRLNPAVYT